MYIEALKKSVSDGKTAVAGAITENGVETATDAEFATMATNIGTVATNKYNAGVAATKKGTAVAAQVLKGQTFTNSSGVNIAGTMNNYSQNIQTVTPTAAQTGVATININDGYHTQIKVNSANVYNAGVAAGKAADKSFTVGVDVEHGDWNDDYNCQEMKISLYINGAKVVDKKIVYSNQNGNNWGETRFGTFSV